MSDITEGNSSMDSTENNEQNMKESPVRDKNEKDDRSSTVAYIMDWVKDIVIALVLAVIISMLIKPTIVKESSMEPNFNENDYIFLSKIAYKFGGQPRRGDVIVFRTHSDKLLDDKDRNKLLIKRVIGLPGDEIRIAEGKVYVNGELDDQSYTKDGETWVRDLYGNQVLEVVVPDNSLFCMGDNREVSIDSRSEDVGCVDEDTVVGKAIFRLLPLSDMGVIKNVNDK